MRAEDLLYQPEWRLMDQSTLALSMDALQSFATDDTLCTSVGSGSSLPTARTWIHDKTVALGVQDARLPFLQNGIDYLKQNGYHIAVRNSGGFAVLLDAGVLNVSLIFHEKQKVSIDRGYEAMAALVKRMLSAFETTVDVHEIKGSYCPGRYDLSIAGKKFAGMSQRRIRSGIAVQAYLCATGSGFERAQLVQRFYQHSLSAWHPKITFPKIQPTTMASLSELLDEPIDAKAMMSLFLMALKHYSSEMTTTPLTPKEIDLFYSYYQRIRSQNEKALTARV